MIQWIVKAALGPLLSLGEKYIDSTTDKAKIKAGVEQAVIKADASFRTSAMDYMAFKVPFFILFGSHALYAAAICLDSFTLTNGIFAPLELPKWYHENFQWVLLGLTGVGPLIVRRK
ncbi:MAG: hypothetical protein GY807_21145 [Gammaproteobacteria bacterium]|nr:hypothetical protein [Gammaproteobacteria bacterium]